MVQTAVRVAATGERAEAGTLWQVLVERYGDASDAHTSHPKN
jgi:hypothetical protein